MVAGSANPRTLLHRGKREDTEEGSAGSMADAPVTAAIESLASFAGPGSVHYAGPVASGVS